MSSLTKVSRYRSGEVRFGRRQYVFDNSVTTYQLTPEQLERYRNGEKIEDILKEVEPMVKQKIDLTVEEYVNFRKQGFSDAVIAAIKKITKQQLYNWKSFRKAQIAELEKELEQKPQESATAEIEQETQETAEQEPTSADVEVTQPDQADDKGIEWLEREVIHAHRLVTEKEEEVAYWKELFETAMADKARLHKENLILENQIQRLKEANQELTERNDRYFSELSRLEQEVKGLRIYALQKLHSDVYGA
jgi:hypothetical protein